MFLARVSLVRRLRVRPWAVGGNDVVGWGEYAQKKAARKPPLEWVWLSGESRSLSDHVGPIGVEELAARFVRALVGVSAEEIALGLQ